jgi:SAM-dependent methyltransferase
MLNSIKYNFGSSYRRQLLDKLQNKYDYLYKGVVLDVGGRDRGKYKKPKERVERWIFADIEQKHNPDVILDVADMREIKTESIDVVNALELFEHVENIEEGISECFRVLKKSGTMLISVPFLFPIHADPYDFQRWTDQRWKKELEKNNFRVAEFEIMGRYFTVISEMIKSFINAMPGLLRKVFMPIYLLLNVLVKTDETNFVLKNVKLNKYHGGYFIIVKK